MLSAQESDDDVDNDGQYGTDYQAGCNWEEKLEIPFLQEYVARQPPHEWNPVPESQT